MSAFQLYLEDIDVSDYVHFNSITEFEQKAEANSIWDFYTDSLDITFDNSIFEITNASADALENFLNKKIQLKYYGNTVLNGIVSEVSYDYTDEAVEVSADSNGKVFINFTIPSASVILKNQNPAGDSVEEISNRIISYVQNQIAEQDLPLTIPGTKIINLETFFPLRTINPGTDIITDFSANASNFINYELDPPAGFAIVLTRNDLYGAYRSNSNNKYYLLYLKQIDPSIFNYNWLIFFAEVGASGFQGEGNWSLTNQNPIGNNFPGYHIPNQNIDPAVVNALKSYLNEENLDIWAKWKFSNSIYYIYINYDNQFQLYRLTVSINNGFIYNYSRDASLGSVMKDIALLTNSICNWNVDGELVFSSRENSFSSILINSEPVELYVEIENKTGEQFEIPAAFADYLTEQSKNDIADFYSGYLQGKFKNFRIVLEQDAIPASKYPLLLKEIQIPVNSTYVNAGIIKQVNFREDLIELKTEVKL